MHYEGREMIDVALCGLGGVIGIYLIVSIRKKKPKSWFFGLLSSIFSALLGFGWTLLSIFVFPALAGAQMNFSGDSEPLPYWAEVSISQAIPSGVVIFLAGTWLTARYCLRARSSEKREEVDY